MEALRRAATELMHEDYMNGIQAPGRRRGLLAADRGAQVVQAKKKKALNYFT